MKKILAFSIVLVVLFEKSCANEEENGEIPPLPVAPTTGD
jgi:hypothetical protein